MKLREIVSAHDPDQAQPGNAAAQISYGVNSVAGSDDGFETADVDARIAGHFARGLGALFEIAQGALFLERIARGNEPPHAVELQPLDREQADRAMRVMRRIERAAEQPDPHAVGVKRDGMSERRDRGLLQISHRGRSAFLLNGFSIRKPALATLENASPENALVFTAASARCHGRGT